MKTYAVRIPDHLAEGVDESCKNLKKSPSDILRMALALLLKYNDRVLASLMLEHEEMQKTITRAEELVRTEKSYYERLKAHWVELKAQTVAMKAATAQQEQMHETGDPRIQLVTLRKK